MIAFLQDEGYWTDKENHQEDSCEVCLDIKSVCCTTCVLEYCLEDQITEGIKNMMYLSKSWLEIIAKLVPLQHNESQKIRELTKKIKDLAKQYWALEADTVRTVRKVKNYGKKLKEAAEDYLQDGILKDFRDVVMNMQDMKDKLEAVNRSHISVRSEVWITSQEAHAISKHHNDLVIKAEEARKDCYTNAILSTPIVGQIAGGYREAVEGMAVSQSVENVVFGVFVGAGRATFKILGMPYYWYKAYTSFSYFDRHNYYSSNAILKDTFNSIAQELAWISDQYIMYQSSMWFFHRMEDCLSHSQTSEENLIAAQNPADKKTMLTKRVIDKADELIEACDDYLHFTVINDTKISEMIGS